MSTRCLRTHLLGFSLWVSSFSSSDFNLFTRSLGALLVLKDVKLSIYRTGCDWVPDFRIHWDVVAMDVAVPVLKLWTFQKIVGLTWNETSICKHLESEFPYCFRRILRLEATTTLLESKLDSVARSRGEAGRVFFLSDWWHYALEHFYSDFLISVHTLGWSLSLLWNFLQLLFMQQWNRMNSFSIAC